MLKKRNVKDTEKHNFNIKSIKNIIFKKRRKTVIISGEEKLVTKLKFLCVEISLNENEELNKLLREKNYLQGGNLILKTVSICF